MKDVHFEMPEDYLNPETRCGFFVSEKRKKIWQTELSLISELARVCNKYQLKWYASNGTLLGAIRHDRFVPWDDDVDIVMPRADYDKLISIASDEFDSPVVLQRSDPERNYFRTHSRLVNVNTTAVNVKQWGRSSSYGIFIDIFPLDSAPDSDFLWKIHKRRIETIRVLLKMAVYPEDFKRNDSSNRIKTAIGRICLRIYLGIFGYPSLLNKFEQLCKKYSDKSTRRLFEITHGARYMVFPVDWYNETEIRKFEYLDIHVPKYYDSILKKHYGDYMALPPVEKRGLHHNIYFDPDMSYEESLKRLSREEAANRTNDY